MHPSYRRSIPKRVIIVVILAAALISSLLLRAAPAHASIPPGNAEQISFGLDSYSNSEQGLRYGILLQQVRTAVSVRSSDGGRQTQSPDGDSAYAVVRLFLNDSPGQQVYLYIRASDLYVVGFSTGSTLFRLQGDPLNSATELPLRGNYNDLNRAADRSLESVPVSRGNIEQSIRDLHAVTASTFENRRMATARALQQLIQMVSEASRFNALAYTYGRELGTNAAPTDLGAGHVGLERSWAQLSRYIYEGRTGTIRAGNYTFQNASAVRRQVNVLLGRTAGYGSVKHDEL